jgi:hypothetical protein
MGRVDDDDDAIRWDETLGWLCDVTAVSGSQAGSLLPMACRVVTGAQGVDTGTHWPPRRGGLVVVVFPSGDPNEDSIILGQLHNTDDAGAPATVNDTTIDEDFALETVFTVEPEKDLDEEWRNVRITGEEMILGTADADQAFARGDDLADAIDDFADAISDFCQSLIQATPAAPNNALTVASAIAAATPLLAAAETFKAAKETWRSTRIKGD